MESRMSASSSSILRLRVRCSCALRDRCCKIRRPLQDGDIVNIDVTVYLDGYHGDTSRMFIVGEAVSILSLLSGYRRLSRLFRRMKLPARSFLPRLLLYMPLRRLVVPANHSEVSPELFTTP